MVEKSEKLSFEKANHKDLTEGSIIKSILYMGIPSMIGFAATTFYSLADMFWISKLGSEEVAAVTLFSSVLWVLSFSNEFIGTGSIAVISRRYGERRFEETANAIKMTFVLKFFFAFISAIAVYPWLREIMVIMKAEGRVIDLGVDYGKILVPAFPLFFVSYSVYTALRAIGNAPHSMYVMLFTTLLNLLLDPFFILYLKWGIKGAAMATVISATTGLVIGLALLASGKMNIKLPLFKDNYLDWEVIGKIITISLPAGLENALRALSYWIITIFISSYGTAIVAAYGIVGKVQEVGILFAVGLELGTSALVGQNLGAKKPERAWKTVFSAAMLACFVAAFLSILQYLFAPQIMRLFTTSEEVLLKGLVILYFYCITLPFISMNITMSSAFGGSGNTLPPVGVVLVCNWGIMITSTWFFSHYTHLEEYGVWISFLLNNVSSFIMNYLLLRRGKWLRRKV